MEILVGTAQRCEQIALYRNVLVPEDVEGVLRESVKKTASTFDEAEGASRRFDVDPMNRACTSDRIAGALLRQHCAIERHPLHRGE